MTPSLKRAVAAVRDLYDGGAGFATVEAVADRLQVTRAAANTVLVTACDVGVLTRLRAERSTSGRGGTGPYLYFPVDD